LISKVIYHFKGGISYTEAITMPLPKLMQIKDHLIKIFQEEEDAMKKARSK
jgi:hypothetical protein